uniref:dolichol kinase n=1 Tax=Cucumis melo TaxID=3656 RepID=A0A9I9ELI8_CUCME
MAFSMSPLLNGERAVVLFFITSLLVSLPFSLLYYGLALSLLTLAALCIEIQAESSNSLHQFKTRPGASSGILLGAITLPGVMLAKMIQLTRAFSSNHIALEEIETWTMQFWSTSTCCLSVLTLLKNSMHESDVVSLACPQRLWRLRLDLGCKILYGVVCYSSLATIYPNVVHVALMLSWIVCHGLVASKLIQHLLCTFPACASIGEALLVTSGLVLYFGDMLGCTIAKVGLYTMNRSEISPIVQGLLLGLLLCSVIFKHLHIWECILNTENSEAKKYFEIRRSMIFFALLGFILIVVVPSWMMVISFTFSEPLKRISLCVYWLSLICASILRFYNISRNSKIERILLRKYYHLMAVLMFLPALIFQPRFLNLAFGAALAVFLALEIIRHGAYFVHVTERDREKVWRIWPLGQPVHQFMNAFTDHRDSELLIVSHFSLLLGCALPIWMSSGYNDRPLAPFAGILSLGIGDTMFVVSAVTEPRPAQSYEFKDLSTLKRSKNESHFSPHLASVVGHKYGVLRWSKTGKKTIEGTAAGITSVLAACSILLPLIASTGYILTELSSFFLPLCQWRSLSQLNQSVTDVRERKEVRRWLSLLLAVTISGLLEAYTAQLDNAFIPLVFFSLLCLYTVSCRQGKEEDRFYQYTGGRYYVAYRNGKALCSKPSYNLLPSPSKKWRALGTTNCNVMALPIGFLLRRDYISEGCVPYFLWSQYGFSVMHTAVDKSSCQFFKRLLYDV